MTYAVSKKKIANAVQQNWKLPIFFRERSLYINFYFDFLGPMNLDVYCELSTLNKLVNDNQDRNISVILRELSEQ